LLEFILIKVIIYIIYVIGGTKGVTINISENIYFKSKMYKIKEMYV